MKIVATSDLHGHLPDTPECDVLVIAGDVCPLVDHRIQRQLEWLDTDFAPWLMKQPAKVVLGIAGNHDFVFEKCREQAAELCLPWIYLQDEAITINGVKFHGIPWVPNLSRWAFHGDDTTLDEKFGQIDDDVDVVISHGPPYLACDLTVPQFGAVHAGAPAANDMLDRVRPKLFFCGHIHEGYGSVKRNDTWIYNVAHQTENYEPINPPVEVRLAVAY